ncbi:hypothetical protein [Xanthomarina spongicola]|uniref:Uncharacterized protein n=1 Tax=Xanthomarina spongicola TaxID=570520 RepID=A0A316DLG7_9FLAO|nr:hypothetical protein [Xanthomarina spongicola]PWK18556.1 hypothetical protein LX78_01863 [Xanthomarina spongicola]
MKKIILIISILSIHSIYSQKCNLSFDQLVNVLSYSQVEFDTFVLENGFSYNSIDQVYNCDKSKKNNFRNIIMRIEERGMQVLVYSFNEKKKYLKFKEIIDDGELSELNDNSGELSFQYWYKEKNIIIQTNTNYDGSNSYMISIAKVK